MPCVPFRFCRPSGTHSFSSLPRTCVLGCNIPPLRSCAASLSGPQWTSRSKVEVRIRAGFSAVPLGLMTNWRAQAGGRGRPPHMISPQRLHLHRKHCRQIPHNRIPAISRIGRGVYLSPGCSEIDAALVKRVHGHSIAQHVYVAVFLWESFGERFPLVAASATAINAQLAFMHKVLGV